MLLFPIDYQLFIDDFSNEKDIIVTLQLHKTKEKFIGKLPNEYRYHADSICELDIAAKLHEKLITFMDVDVQLTTNKKVILYFYNCFQSPHYIVHCFLNKMETKKEDLESEIDKLRNENAFLKSKLKDITDIIMSFKDDNDDDV